MSPLRPAIFGLLIALAGCATPQERCINAATKDLRVVDGLIAQSQANLARGYAVRERTEVVPDWEWCQPSGYVRDANGNLRPLPPRMCMSDRAVTRRYPVAIDLAEEQKKLDGLIAKRKVLVAQSAAGVEECRALNPA